MKTKTKPVKKAPKKVTVCDYYARRSKVVIQPHTGSQPPFNPLEMARMLNWPTNVPGTPLPIYLIELGGGYSLSAINSWCDQQHPPIPHPVITNVFIDGATNAYTGDPGSADAEVELDICCACAQSYSTGKPTPIFVVFCQNTDSSFLKGVQACKGSTGISWGSPEKNWSQAAMNAMNAAFEAGAGPYNCAAGDAGSGDGLAGDNSDYPGSSPSKNVVCVGGTTTVTNMVNGIQQIVSQSVWHNADGGATGGGVSAVFAAPSWQSGFVTVGKGRASPDLCVNADPNPGWSTPFGGIGGTSAGAPFMAAYFSVVKMLLGEFAVTPLLYKCEPAFFDITVGNNGDFSATKGFDETSGFGVPDGSALLKMLTALMTGVVTPPPTTSPPPVIQPPVANPPGMTLQSILTELDGDLRHYALQVPRQVSPYILRLNSLLQQRFKQIFMTGHTTVTHAVPLVDMESHADLSGPALDALKGVLTGIEPILISALDGYLRGLLSPTAVAAPHAFKFNPGQLGMILSSIGTVLQGVGQQPTGGGWGGILGTILGGIGQKPVK